MSVDELKIKLVMDSGIKNSSSNKKNKKNKDNINNEDKNPQNKNPQNKNGKTEVNKDLKKLFENLLKTGMPYNIRRVSDVMFKYAPIAVPIFASFKILGLIYDKLSELNEYAKERALRKKDLFFNNYLSQGKEILHQPNINHLLNVAKSSVYLQDKERNLIDEFNKLYSSGRMYKTGFAPDEKLETILAHFGLSSVFNPDIIVKELSRRYKLMDKEQFYAILDKAGLGTTAAAIIENERMKKNNEEIFNFNNEKTDKDFLKKAKISIDYENWKESFYQDIARISPQLSKSAWRHVLESAVMMETNQIADLAMSISKKQPEKNTQKILNKINLDIQRKNNNAEIQRGIETAIANDLDFS